VPTEEGGDVAGDRRIGRIRQAELDDRRASLLQRHRHAALREKAVDQKLPDFIALELDRSCAADQPRAAAEQRQQHDFRRAGASSCSLAAGSAP
jgi:hypothetical protein